MAMWAFWFYTMLHCSSGSPSCMTSTHVCEVSTQHGFPSAEYFNSTPLDYYNNSNIALLHDMPYKTPPFNDFPHPSMTPPTRP